MTTQATETILTPDQIAEMFRAPVTVKPIRAYGGQQIFSCHECREPRVHRVAYHVTGQYRNESKEMIFVDVVTDAQGHRLVENSH